MMNTFPDSATLEGCNRIPLLRDGTGTHGTCGASTSNGNKDKDKELLKAKNREYSSRHRMKINDEWKRLCTEIKSIEAKLYEAGITFPPVDDVFIDPKPISTGIRYRPPDTIRSKEEVAKWRAKLRLELNRKRKAKKDHDLRVAKNRHSMLQKMLLSNQIERELDRVAKDDEFEDLMRDLDNDTRGMTSPHIESEIVKEPLDQGGVEVNTGEELGLDEPDGFTTGLEIGDKLDLESVDMGVFLRDD